MVLIYEDGSRTEALILARTEHTLRVAIPGSDDPLELTNIHGTWVTDDCEPVRVQFAWEGKTRDQILTEADCVCSKQLAGHLLRLLFSASDEDPRNIQPKTLAASAFVHADSTMQN